MSALVAAIALIAVTPASTAWPPRLSAGAAAGATTANSHGGLDLSLGLGRVRASESRTPSSASSDLGRRDGEAAMIPPPAVFDAPAAPAAPPPPMLRATAPPAGGGVWAVIIGIDDYPGTRSDLRSAVSDANDVDAALAAYGVPPEHRLVLRNTQASASVIADSLRWIVARAGTDSTAVIFYAGHVRKVNGREAVVGADGRVVTDAAMADLLRPLAARHTWIVVAACFAGGFTEVLAPGRILTGAADANSYAWENAAYGNSYLVEYLINRAMLGGKAAASVEQSYAWAHDALQAEHPDRVPVQYDKVDGEIRLGATPPPKPPSDAPPPSSQPPSDESGDDGSPDNANGQCLLTLGTIASCNDRTTRS